MRKIDINSHKGIYTVEFNDQFLQSNILETLGTHYIIDKTVFKILGPRYYKYLADKQIVLIDANENSKSFIGVEPVIQALIEKKLKRDSTLVAVGGGITQDITCFVANNYMRGIKWNFVPTTLLAQADSCIGSKSSINFGNIKNLLGSYCPPEKIHISSEFLTTLNTQDITSGIGEILKLFLIDGKAIHPASINLQNMSQYVFEALQIKKKFIEEDEFDKGIRNILNYGHCFGHAFESASNYRLPHGIAISIGMDVANLIALEQNLITSDLYEYMHRPIKANYQGYETVPMAASEIFAALSNDKKNTGSKVNLILPVGNTFEKKGYDLNDEFKNHILNVFAKLGINCQS